jgi:hypothetical protein
VFAVRNWKGISISSTGQYQTAVASNGNIHISYNFGANWSDLSANGAPINANWYSVSISATGQYQTACVSGGGGIYISSNFGANWSLVSAVNGIWYSVSISSTGQYQSAVSAAPTPGIYISSNFGVNWSLVPVQNGVPANLNWLNISVSATGQYQSAQINAADVLYFSRDYGVTWSTYASYNTPVTTTTTTPATVRAIAYGNSGTGASIDGYWVAGADASANTLAYSSNGIDWSAVVGSKTSLFNAVNGVAYGADISGTMMWVAVGTPFIGSVYGSTAYSIAYSYNMTTWNGILNVGNFTGQGNHVAYGQDENGNGIWVAVGQRDGVSPTTDICGNYLMGASSTTLFYSYDGIRWISCSGTGVFAAAGNDVSWGLDASGVSTWVATGVGYTNSTTGAYIAGGRIAYSQNGRVWTPANTATTPPFTTAGLTVGYGNAGTNGTGLARWIVGGSGGNVFWYSSRPSNSGSGVWSSMTDTSANAPFPVCNSIQYSNGIWVAANNTNATNTIARSTDGGLTWVRTPLSTASSFTGGCASVGSNSYCNFSLAFADYSVDTNLRSWVAIPGTKNLMFDGGVNTVATVTPNVNASTYTNRAWWVAGGKGTFIPQSDVVYLSIPGTASIAYTTDSSGSSGWTLGTSGTGNQGSGIIDLDIINSIAFSPHTQRWLAVGKGSAGTPTRTVLYSDVSGITWTSAIASSSNSSLSLNTCRWNQLDASASAAGRWLAAGTTTGTGNSAASLFISTDVSGINWSTVAGTGAILSQIYSITYNGVAWIAAGVPAIDSNGGKTCTLMRTFDISGASNWQPITGTVTSGTSPNNGDGGFDTSARSITWNSDQNMWIATGENTGIADASFSSVIYSVDISGSPGTWRSVRESNSLFSIQGNGIAYTGSKWVAAGEGTNTVVTSSDISASKLNSWTRLSSGSNAITSRATDIAYTGTTIVATGQLNGGAGTTGAIVSTDASGTSWSTKNVGFIDSSGGATSIAYEPSYDGGLLVSTGKGATNAISYSTDYGITWAQASTRDASGANSTFTQQLFTNGGNSVAYIGNDTLLSGGGNDVHWNGKRWVAVGKTSDRATDPTTSTVTAPGTTERVIVNNNTSSIAISDDGIMWSSVPSNQTSEMTDGTFIATNSRIGATPLINSQIIIMDGGDTEMTGDFGNNASSSLINSSSNATANGMGAGIAQIDIISENQIIPSATSAISNSNQLDLLGVGINANGTGMTPIPSFDNTSFTITVRPLP